MFTGIITEVGKIISTKPMGGGVMLSIGAPISAAEMKIGDSVCIDGVCLTAVECSDGKFSVEAVEETLRKTALGERTAGDGVNLELALRMGDRLGGHIVQGHVDGVGTVSGIDHREESDWVSIKFPKQFAKYVIPVGSIAVDGISLTVASSEGEQFSISLIPHTLEVTTFASLKVGKKVNLEFDVLGKYVEQLLKKGGDGGGISMEKLRSWGW